MMIRVGELKRDDEGGRIRPDVGRYARAVHDVHGSGTAALPGRLIYGATHHPRQENARSA